MSWTKGWVFWESPCFQLCFLVPICDCLSGPADTSLLISDAISSLIIPADSSECDSSTALLLECEFSLRWCCKERTSRKGSQRGCVAPASTSSGLLAGGSGTDNTAGLSEISLLTCFSRGWKVKKKKGGGTHSFGCSQTSPWFLLLQETVAGEAWNTSTEEIERDCLSRGGIWILSDLGERFPAFLGSRFPRGNAFRPCMWFLLLASCPLALHVAWDERLERSMFLTLRKPAVLSDSPWNTDKTALQGPPLVLPCLVQATALAVIHRCMCLYSFWWRQQQERSVAWEHKEGMVWF